MNEFIKWLMTGRVVIVKGRTNSYGRFKILTSNFDEVTSKSANINYIYS